MSESTPAPSSRDSRRPRPDRPLERARRPRRGPVARAHGRLGVARRRSPDVVVGRDVPHLRPRAAADPGLVRRAARPRPSRRPRRGRGIGRGRSGGEDRFSLTHRVLRPDGEVRHVEARGRRSRARTTTDAATSCSACAPRHHGRGLRHAARASTPRSQALADSEELYRLLAENAWDVIWTMELDGSISYVSPAVERMRGITPAEAKAQTLDQIHPPESAAEGHGVLHATCTPRSRAARCRPRYHGEQ